MLKKIGFYGLSHLGLCYSAAYAKKNLDVVAVDLNKKKIINLKKNVLDIFEKDLLKITKSKKIVYSNNISDLNKCDIVFFSNDVKTNAKNISNISDIRRQILYLDKKIYKSIPIIILSQVPPGFTRLLDLKRKLFYQVETLIFGEAMSRALHPERIIIGKKNNSDLLTNEIKKMYNIFTPNIIEMNYESAELAKISINLMLISSIMTSNFISLYCEKMNARWSDIKRSLHLDKRIGKFAYLNPSPGLSGGNLERDLMNSNKLFNYKKILNGWINLDQKMKRWTINLVKKNLPKKSSILICGITYKENTLSVKNSLSLFLLKQLGKVYNITILEKNKKLNNLIKNNMVNTLSRSNKKFDCVIFINNMYNPKSMKQVTKNNTFYIDPYGFFKKYFMNKNTKYSSIGNN